MSGIMLNLVGGTYGGIPVIGSAYQGGFFAGQISTSGNGIATHNLVVGPVASAENSSRYYRNTNTATPGAESVIDGVQNTADMIADGNATTYPAAHFCNDLVIGGFSDWYLPAKDELEVCYYNLKPTTTGNVTSVGANTNAVPSRAGNYTGGTPAQTSATNFRDTGAEDFTNTWYWSSTEKTANTATGYAINFLDGNLYPYDKGSLRRVRAIRRVAV